MTEYPYGRSGSPIVFYQDTATDSDFEKVKNTGDNEIKRKGGSVYVYEAPADDDTGRGHLSEWEQQDDESYTPVDKISGDDGMIYDKFQQS